MDVSLRASLVSVGIEAGRALTGGHQSLVYRGRFAATDVVVKAVDGRLTPPAIVHQQAQLAADLAAIDPRVVAPLPVEGQTVLVMGHHLVTVLPFVTGHVPNLDDRTEAEWLGAQLAMLHASMRCVSADLPLVASLRVPGLSAEGDCQLIHGDPSPANIQRNGDAAHVLDFGEAGLGTPAYDVALALFSRRFQTWRRHSEGTGSNAAQDEAPRALHDGYEQASTRELNWQAVEDGLVRRREALAWWLEHLDEAPVGIRTSSAAWRATLARFVNEDREA